MFKRLKSGWASKEGKLKAFILASGILLLVVVITIAILELTSTPQFCKSCHEMRPEYVTWKASSHSQIRCVECHIEPGAKNFIVHKVKSLKEVYKHFTGQVYPPITSSEPIKDVVCERCHTENRVATPSGDIKIPHNVHKEEKVPCVKCHSAVAHANIGERGFTADGNWDKWIEPVGMTYMRADFLKFSMSECLSCHKEEGAGPKPNNCEACHNKLIKPESHKEPMFNTKHGLKAKEDIKQCDKCHQITISPKEPRIPVHDPVVTYARQNTFCSNCHSAAKTPPPSHTITWKRTHVLQASEYRTGCLVCHDEGKPTKGSSATKTFCYQCHQTNIHYDVIVLGRHINGPKVNASVEPTRNPCFACHSGPYCQKCHYFPASTSELSRPEFRKPLSPDAKLSPGYPDYGSGSPSGKAGGNGSSSPPRSYNTPIPETG